MRAAIIEWQDIFGESMYHAILGNANDDDKTLAGKAERWALMSLSEKAFEKCTIELYTLVVDVSTVKKVK
jgi:hypothetical protein